MTNLCIIRHLTKCSTCAKSGYCKIGQNVLRAKTFGAICKVGALLVCACTLIVLYQRFVTNLTYWMFRRICIAKLAIMLQLFPIRCSCSPWLLRRALPLFRGLDALTTACKQTLLGHLRKQRCLSTSHVLVRCHTKYF